MAIQVNCCATAQLGDVGFVFEVQWIKLDGSPVPMASASLIELRLKNPDGATVTRTGVLTTAGGADGKVRYVSIAGDLNLTGKWLWQFRCTAPGLGGPKSTKPVELEVLANC